MKTSRCFPPEIFLFAIFVIPILLFSLEKRNENKSNLKRETELLADFPEIISKFSLLNLAGLSISNALFQIVFDYQQSLSSNKSKRFVYEELSEACNKIKNGIYEEYVYEEMGRKFGLSCYVKFSSLLISGLKHGTADFNTRLSAEVTSSLLEHKAELLRKGSVASTKLLGPMMMIFASILILIMVPAFFSISF